MPPWSRNKSCATVPQVRVGICEWRADDQALSGDLLDHPLQRDALHAVGAGRPARDAGRDRCGAPRRAAGSVQPRRVGSQPQGNRSSGRSQTGNCRSHSGHGMQDMQMHVFAQERCKRCYPMSCYWVAMLCRVVLCCAILCYTRLSDAMRYEKVRALKATKSGQQVRTLEPSKSEPDPVCFAMLSDNYV